MACLYLKDLNFLVAVVHLSQVQQLSKEALQTAALLCTSLYPDSKALRCCQAGSCLLGMPQLLDRHDCVGAEDFTSSGQSCEWDDTLASGTLTRLLKTCSCSAPSYPSIRDIENFRIPQKWAHICNYWLKNDED